MHTRALRARVKVFRMGYVRYKLPEQTHEMLRRMSSRFGMKESEVSRIALMEYMRSLGVLSERVHRAGIAARLERLKHRREREENGSEKEPILLRLKERIKHRDKVDK